MAKLRNIDLYVRSMGKLLKVTHIYDAGLDGICDANQQMEDGKAALVAEEDGYLFLADRYDRGIKG